MQEMFGAVAVGFLLLVIGNGTGKEWVFLVGGLISPLAFLWGALFKSEGSLPVKITLLAIGGLLMVATTQLFGGASLSSFFR